MQTDAFGSVANDDSPFSVAEIIGEMMADVYSHGMCFKVHGYECRLKGDGDDLRMPNVWTIHPPEGGRAIDAVNLSNFKTASEFETYLLEEIADREDEKR